MLKGKNVAVICSLDGYANSDKPAEIKTILESRGHKITLINTKNISRLSDNGVKRLLPSPTLKKLSLYSLEVLAYLINKYSPKSYKRFLTYGQTMMQMRLRSYIVARLLSAYDIIICENAFDSLVLLKDLSGAKKIYDCATPLADELYYGALLTEAQYRKFKKMEISVYDSVDHLSFHWKSYADYVKKYYKDTGNIFTFDSSVQCINETAHYAREPRIVYIGYLGGYWINLPLLSRLSKLYNIDVYGSPAPDAKYGLNYKGYANPSVLADYQFGLITITQDRLRREGFSAKHLVYLSFGLPTLVPEWRTSAGLIKGSIFYNENNFLDVIKKYSSRQAWEAASRDALTHVKLYSTENTMREFIAIIEA